MSSVQFDSDGNIIIIYLPIKRVVFQTLQNTKQGRVIMHCKQYLLLSLCCVVIMLLLLLSLLCTQNGGSICLNVLLVNNHLKCFHLLMRVVGGVTK